MLTAWWGREHLLWVINIWLQFETCAICSIFSCLGDGRLNSFPLCLDFWFTSQTECGAIGSMRWEELWSFDTIWDFSLEGIKWWVWCIARRVGWSGVEGECRQLCLREKCKCTHLFHSNVFIKGNGFNLVSFYCHMVRCVYSALLVQWWRLFGETHDAKQSSAFWRFSHFLEIAFLYSSIFASFIT